MHIEPTETTSSGIATGTSTHLPKPGLRERPGRWLDGWDPEDAELWNSAGQRIAQTNLRWSIFAEFLGFAVWQLWSIVAVQLPGAGFNLDSSQIFWLISVPSLVGATLRIPYTFMVGWFGGRNWTVVSALLLLIPVVGLIACLGNPDTSFAVMLLVAALAGLGGGNFASSMTNITYFFPQQQQGKALGLNAAGGNLGAAVAQFAVPLVISLGAATSLNLAVAGWVWIPLILVSAWGARRFMHNLSNAKGDFAGAAAALREPHLWILAVLYIGTFGSFIGFTAVFPKLIADSFAGSSTLDIGAAAISLAFLGPLVGSLARPVGGRFADRFGGAQMTIASFVVMVGAAMAVVCTMPLENFTLFLGLFLLLFTASGFGNGSTYRMIPIVFALRGRQRGGSAPVSARRQAAAALGLISALGAYGGFLVPQLMNVSQAVTGNYAAALYGLAASYGFLLALCWFFYMRRQAPDGVRI